MKGWTGNILRVNLTTKTYKKEPFSEEFAATWIGGRGFAVKILYDELKPGIDPLGPENKLIVALGPISGIPAPNTGKAVVAAKSPLTGFYGDGNLGTRVSEQLRKAGYDAMIVEGKAARPSKGLMSQHHSLDSHSSRLMPPSSKIRDKRATPMSPRWGLGKISRRS